MYLKANPPPHSALSWDGQSPPLMKLQKGKAVASLKDDEGKVRLKLLKENLIFIFFIVLQPLAHFGPYIKKREEKLMELRIKNGPLWKIDDLGKVFLIIKLNLFFSVQ